MGKKKLIVNADDFGQSPGINRGIIKAYEDGIVTSASLMVRYPSANAAVEYAKNNRGLSVGLHVDLGEWIYKNEDWEPLYEVVSLDNREALQQEIRNQVNTFITIMGFKPTHIDSHQHVHKRENLQPIFFEIAEELNVPLRHYSTKVSYCGDFYGQYEDSSPFHYGVSKEGLAGIISRLPEGITEIACHPAYPTDIETMYRVERELEVETLCDQGIREVIKRTGIEIVSFQDVMEG